MSRNVTQFPTQPATRPEPLVELTPAGVAYMELDAENRRLRAEVEELRLERDAAIRALTTHRNLALEIRHILAAVERRAVGVSE